MANRIEPPSPRTGARIIGGVYLAYFLIAILAELLLSVIVVSGDAAATVNHILAHPSLFRAGFAAGLVSTACYVAVTALLYELLKPVSPRLSFMAALFSLVGCAVQTLSGVFELAPLAILSDQHPSLVAADQSRLLAQTILKLHAQALEIALVFFGAYCLLLGWLIFRSGFLPRAIGLLMALAGAGWLSFLWPPLAAPLSGFTQVLGFIAEASLMLWLLIKGVDAARWERLRARSQA